MKKAVAAVLLLTAAVTSAAPARAAEKGFYIGANAGFTRTSAISGIDPSKVTGGLFSLLGGYQFNKYLAGEIQYAYLGKAEYTDLTFNSNGGSASTRTHSFSVNAVGTWPIQDEFSLYGKLGLAVNRTSISNFDVQYTGKMRFMPTVGLGVQYDVIPAVGLRMGWDRYDGAFENGAGANMHFHKNAWSLGAIYRF